VNIKCKARGTNASWSEIIFTCGPNRKLATRTESPVEQRSKEKWVTVQRAVGTQEKLKSTKQQMRRGKKKGDSFNRHRTEQD
jgi:hypothetical protein